MIEKMVLTVCETANLLRVDHETVYRLVKRKELTGFKVAGSVGS